MNDLHNEARKTNSTDELESQALSDVAVLSPGQSLESELAKVGLERVEMLVKWGDILLPARGFASVDLIDKKSRGIHMSRLFKILNEMKAHELSWASLQQVAQAMRESHGHLSTQADLELELEVPMERQALLSGETGIRHYPVRLQTHFGPRAKFTLEFKVLYSSTCPCSAGLSRELLAKAFLKRFSKFATKSSPEAIADWLKSPEATIATPHAQRSEAICRISWDKIPSEELQGWLVRQIDEVECSLGTPVQTAVKRIDEQEFARRNASHLMFCEDAARKIKAHFNTLSCQNFRIEVRHFESLHAHDVVAVAVKDLAPGSSANH